jgi:uncharacterized membrane protein YsdA (DUF1294 family)
MPMVIWVTAGAWYLTLNLAAAGLLCWDKGAARAGRRRIRERTLLRVIWLGGFLGAPVAMRLARHKTRKRSFTLAWIAALALHGAAWALLMRAVAA